MKRTNWNHFAPWFLTIACTVVLLIIGVFLVDNIQWYKKSVFDPAIHDVNEPSYRFYAYHMHLSMIKRSIGLFSGFTILFLGLGVAFFTLKNPTNIDAQSGGFTAKIATASPGIIALLVGAYLISSTISSKDQFPEYRSAAPSGQQIPDTLNRPKLPTDL